MPIIQRIFYALCRVEHHPLYCTVYGRAAPFRGPDPPDGLLLPASINGRFTADAAMIWPGVLLLRTPEVRTSGLESDMVLGAKHLRGHDFVPGQLIVVRGACGGGDNGSFQHGVTGWAVDKFLATPRVVSGC